MGNATENKTTKWVGKMKEIVMALKGAIIALLLFFCFAKQITTLLSSFNNKWMAGCDTIVGGIFIIVVIAFLMWYLFDKWQKTKLSVSHIGWIVVAIAVYVYYRHFEHTFLFWGFDVLGRHFAYTDAFIVVLFQIGYYQYKINKQPCNAQIGGLCMIDDDEPIEKVDDDILGYGNIIRSLLSDLDTLDLREHSYSVGVAGEWGLGKSSFFNIFKKILKEDKYKDNSIIVEFNPRTATDVKDIQKDFFDKYASELAKYHSGIGRDMQRYQDALDLPESNFVIRLMRLLPTLTVSKSKDAINDVIKEIGRRIYVFVDDFDRLTAKEILEVMKFVDRNGDFRQTIFITAYDKEYVNNVLMNYLKHRKKDAFTDKYFNYEIPLPVQPRDVLSNYVKKALAEKLKEESGDAITIKQMQDEWAKIARPISEQLRTLRHVKRFLNIFLSRYSKVRNDVVFGDFVRVTLLRYYDITCYHALVEGKLTKGGGLLSMNNNVLYRVDQIEDKLKRYSKWEGSKELLFELLNESVENDYELTSKYKRLQFVRSFPCYFYDYQPSGVYHKQLIALYDAESFGSAVDYLLKLIKYNKGKNQYDQASYIAVENFLRVRPVSELRNQEDVMRMFSLLCYLNKFVGRSINIEASLYYMLGRNFFKQLDSLAIIPSETQYKENMRSCIVEQLKDRPSSLAFVLGQMYDEMRRSSGDVNDYMFTQEEMKGLAEWSQKYYFSKVDKITQYNLEAIVTLSRIFKDSQNGKSVLTKSAQHEFGAFISLHADEFVSSVIKIVKTKTAKVKLNISIADYFDPSEFFPCDGVDIQDWVKKEVNSMYLSFLFNRLLKEEDRSMVVDLLPGDYSINEGDYSQVYNVVKAADELAAEKKVLTAMKQQVANSIDLLSKQTGMPKDEVRTAIQRMKQKGDLNDTQANVAEAIPAFKVGDFVRIKDNDLEKYQIAQGHAFNLYKIREIAETGVRLDDVEETVSPECFEAVPIDGMHDKKVYYDPIIAASIIPPGGKIPVHRTDYSYFMDKFKNCLNENKKTFADIVKERDYHFVHEVQHWLRDHGDDGMKIYTFGY